MKPLERPLWDFSQLRDKNLLWLDKNECNYLPTRNLLKAIYEKIDLFNLSTYPDLTRCYELFSKTFKTNQENAYFTYGSDAAIKIFFELSAQKYNYSKALIMRPSFGMYEVYAKYYCKDIEYIDYEQLDNDYEINYQIIKNKISYLKEGDVFVIANPESPLGIVFEENKIQDLIQICYEKGVLFLLDETYIGFATQKSQRYLINHYSNLFITGSFSKTWGLAGIRLGYLISNKDNIKIAKLNRFMYEIGGFQSQILELCLEKFNEFENSLKDQIFHRNSFVNLLRNNDIEAINTSANFIHLKKSSLNANYKNNLSKVFIFKEISHRSLSHTIRLTLPDPNKFDIIIESLKHII